IIARQLAKGLTDELGQSVIVENRPGGSTIIGTENVAKSPPDGYTLLMGAVGSHAIHAAMPDKPGYDFATAFVGVSMATSMPMAVAVNSKVPANNVQELIALAKSKPGTITFGSAGPGTSQHMAGELFQVVTGTRLMHVPYRGSGPAITDLLGGQIDMVIETLPALLPQVASGKIRLLGVTTAKRATALPDLPTLMEQGVKDYSVATAYALLAPAGTPPGIVDALSRGIADAVAVPALKQQLAGYGYETVGSTPAEFASHIDRELDTWKQAVTVSGAKLN
ncbi:MAG TPA: MFS transporter, partial [Achromobacter sp.]|nr:MFS transporter [Achromobacter sp.]